MTVLMVSTFITAILLFNIATTAASTSPPLLSSTHPTTAVFLSMTPYNITSSSCSSCSFIVSLYSCSSLVLKETYMTPLSLHVNSFVFSNTDSSWSLPSSSSSNHVDYSTYFAKASITCQYDSRCQLIVDNKSTREDKKATSTTTATDAGNKEVVIWKGEECNSSTSLFTDDQYVPTGGGSFIMNATISIPTPPSNGSSKIKACHHHHHSASIVCVSRGVLIVWLVLWSYIASSK